MHLLNLYFLTHYILLSFPRLLTLSHLFYICKYLQRSMPTEFWLKTCWAQRDVDFQANLSHPLSKLPLQTLMYLLSLLCSLRLTRQLASTPHRRVTRLAVIYKACAPKNTSEKKKCFSSRKKARHSTSLRNYFFADTFPPFWRNKRKQLTWRTGRVETTFPTFKYLLLVCNRRAKPAASLYRLCRRRYVTRPRR